MDNELLMKILERLSAIESKLESLLPLKEDVSKNKLDINSLQLKIDQHEKELEEIKENTKWLRRLVISGFITIGTGLIVALLKGILGI